MKCPEKNKECVTHFKEGHGPACVTTGKNKCQDYLHNKKCFSANDIDEVGKIFDRVIALNEKTI